MNQDREAARQPDERNRRDLLDASHRLLHERGGITLRLDDITLEMVAAEAGLSRATVYRTWSNRDDFELDLLCDLAGPNSHGAAAFDQQTIDLASRIVAENLDKLADPVSRLGLLREVVRLGAAQNFEAAKTSIDWRGYVALSATAMTMANSPRRDRVLAALTASEELFLDKMSAFYEDMGGLLGIRIRDGVGTYRHVAAAGASVVEGLSIRHLLNPELVDRPLIIEGPNGPEEWTLASWGFFGVINQMTEPDPDYDPATALSQYFLRKSGSA